MKTTTTIHWLAGLAGGLLLVVPALGWAASPWGAPGGPIVALEACEAEQAVCETELANCLETGGSVFPGDGQTGAPLAYEDNGDGTFTDPNTGLMWEIKDGADSVADYDNPHDVDNQYSLPAIHGAVPEGTATEFLAELNSEPGFAGHTDWRLPTVKELQSLVDYSAPYPGPAVKQDPDGLPGATAPAYWPWSSGEYWSSSSHAFRDVYAWSVPFGYGDVGYDNKASEDHVRAVRGGW
jgi:hypothetical protein